MIDWSTTQQGDDTLNIRAVYARDGIQSYSMECESSTASESHTRRDMATALDAIVAGKKTNDLNAMGRRAIPCLGCEESW